jgi:hypothetical protein
MPLSTSPSVPLGSIDIYPATDILVDVTMENLFSKRKNGGGSPSEALGPGTLDPSVNTGTRRGEDVSVSLQMVIGIDARTRPKSRLEQ